MFLSKYTNKWNLSRQRTWTLPAFPFRFSWVWLSSVSKNHFLLRKHMWSVVKNGQNQIVVSALQLLVKVQTGRPVSHKVHTSPMHRVTLTISFWNNVPSSEPAWLPKCFFIYFFIFLINISRSRNAKTVRTVTQTSALKGIVCTKVTWIISILGALRGRWEFPACFSAFGNGSQRFLPASLLKRRRRKNKLE